MSLQQQRIQPYHLNRLALVYLRQSSPGQVIHHQESLRLQYELANKPLLLGWDPTLVRVIDCDLGLSGTSAHNRHGFQELSRLVWQGDVGLIVAWDATRLARNFDDWQGLMRLTVQNRCLIADQESLFDPTDSHDRLLLGIHGVVAEFELHGLRRKLTAGLLSKAERGDLELGLPTGLVRDAAGQIVKIPDREVQERIQLVFSTYLEQKTLGKTVRFFQNHQLPIPRGEDPEAIVWRPATVGMIHSVLTNAAYAGIYGYGKTGKVFLHESNGVGRTVRRRLPMAEWKVCLRDHYPGYITGETYDQIQTMLQDHQTNFSEQQANRGVAREGKALLQGLVYCGHCGHKMQVTYKKNPRYCCSYFRKRGEQDTDCQKVPMGPIDAQVERFFLEALTPVELDLYGAAVAQQQTEQAAVQRAQQQHLDRLRYQADLAQRQYLKVDPENRRVAGCLEQRWEAAMAELAQAEAEQRRREEAPTLQPLSAEVRTMLESAGRDLPQLWRHPQMTPERKKGLLRCLVEKVVLRRLSSDQIETRVVWQGGATSTALVTTPVTSLRQVTGWEDLEREVLELASQGVSDEEIARRLTEKGYRSPHKGQVLESTVQTIRLRHGKYAEGSGAKPRKVKGSMTVSEVAKKLGVAPHWIYDRIRKGVIEVSRAEGGPYLFPRGRETVKQFRELQRGERTQLRFGEEVSGKE